MAFGVGWMIPLLGMVYVLQIGAIPNAPYCGGLDEGKSVKTIINKPDFVSSENAFVDLSPKEEVIIEFTVERIDGRRLSNCDDDIVFQPVDPVDGDDCNESPSQSPVKFNNDAEGEDDDFVVGEDDQNIGKDSHALTFYVKDKRYDVIHSVLVERTVDIAKFQRFLRVRGQRGSTCGHPTLVEATNVEGTGKVIVNVKKFSHQSNWNKAEVSFDNAKDIEDEAGWCGNINWIKSGGACMLHAITPKWKVELDTQEQLLVDAFLRGRGSENLPLYKAARVSLHVFRNNGKDKVETIMDEYAYGKFGPKLFSFVNKFSKQTFYLELEVRKRHLYEYALAFEVNSGDIIDVERCVDETDKFEIPKEMKSCQWLAAKEKRIRRYCNSPKSNASTICRKTCQTGSQDNADQEFHKRKRNCPYVELKLKNNNNICNDDTVKNRCPRTCQKC